MLLYLMTFGKINDIIKFINQYLRDNDLGTLEENFYEIVRELTKKTKEHFSESSFALVEDILLKRYQISYNIQKLSFKNGLNCFPEFNNLYCDIEIPKEYQKMENHFQKLKNLPQPEQKSDEWFAYRKERITASDTASAIDLNPYEPVESFIMKKADPTHKFLDNQNVYHGKKYELIATKIYEHIYNNQVFEFGALPSDKYPLFGASPDGICSAKTLDNKFSDRLGTMLEIKCVAPRGRTIYTSGKIEGHICPYYYYLQVQQQLECCDLDVCDFWQCKLTEYKNREAYLIDNCSDTQHSHGIHGTPMEINCKIKKGMLLQFYPFKFEPEFDGDQKEWKSKFIYPPRLDMNEHEYNNWFVKTMDTIREKEPELIKDYYFHKVIYWKLEQSHNQPIKRDRELFLSILPIMEQTWKRVQYYRDNLDKLYELKTIVDKRSKWNRTDTSININTDIIKNKILFLNDAPKKTTKKIIKNEPDENQLIATCDFIDDNVPKKTKKIIKDEPDENQLIATCDFIDDDVPKKTKKVVKEPDENQLIATCDFIDDDVPKKTKKVVKEPDENQLIAMCDFIDDDVPKKTKKVVKEKVVKTKVVKEKVVKEKVVKEKVVKEKPKKILDYESDKDANGKYNYSKKCDFIDD